MNADGSTQTRLTSMPPGAPKPAPDALPANANSGRRAYFHELIRSRLAAYALQDRGNLTFFLDTARKIASRVVREVEEAKGSVNRAAG